MGGRGHLEGLLFLRLGVVVHAGRGHPDLPFLEAQLVDQVSVTLVQVDRSRVAVPEDAGRVQCADRTLGAGDDLVRRTTAGPDVDLRCRAPATGPVEGRSAHPQVTSLNEAVGGFFDRLAEHVAVIEFEG